MEFENYFLFRAPTMLRFDPTRSDHSKFVEEKRNKKRTKGKDDKDRPAKRAKHDETAEKEQAQNDEPPVSMDHFYEVRSDFQKSLGGGGFSLLSMFNRTADDGVVKTMPGAVDKSYEEKLIAKNSVKFEIDPFKGESSDEEADEKAATVKKMVEGQLSHESFFTMNSSDSRVAGRQWICCCCCSRCCFMIVDFNQTLNFCFLQKRYHSLNRQ